MLCLWNVAASVNITCLKKVFFIYFIEIPTIKTGFSGNYLGLQMFLSIYVAQSFYFLLFFIIKISSRITCLNSRTICDFFNNVGIKYDLFDLFLMQVSFTSSLQTSVSDITNYTRKSLHCYSAKRSVSPCYNLIVFPVQTLMCLNLSELVPYELTLFLVMLGFLYLCRP